MLGLVVSEWAGQGWGRDETGKGVGQSKALAASDRSSCVVGVVTSFCGCVALFLQVWGGQQGASGPHPSFFLASEQLTGHDQVSPVTSSEASSHPWVLALGFLFSLLISRVGETCLG